MPKQQNALTCYIHHSLLPELQRQGRTFPNGIADVIPIAVPLFKSLPPNERARYEEMAKNLKKNRGGVGGGMGRRDNCGNIIANRQDPRVLLMQKRKDDRAFMKIHFPSDDALLDYKFYVMGFEYAVEIENSPQNEFMPVEVGIVEWSMREGITKCFHHFMNPGDLPLGYRFKFQEHADEFHKLSLEEIRGFTKNYSAIWAHIEDFVKPQDEDHAVYCLDNELEKIDGCLKWLHKRSNAHGRPIRFRIRLLEDLAHEFYSRQGKNIAESSIRDMLTTSVFDYDPNTSCKEHEDRECKHCAIGTAKRYTYALSDAMSVIYDFHLTEKHVPVRNEQSANYIVTGPNRAQLVPEIARYPPAAAGRGYTVQETGGFGSRDIRYRDAGTRADNVSQAAGYDETRPSSVLNFDSRRFANTTARPPPAESLPAPSFAASSVSSVETMDDDCESQYSSSTQMSPFLPTRSPDKPEAFHISSSVPAMQLKSEAASNLSSVGPFAAPMFGRGRAMSALISTAPSGTLRKPGCDSAVRLTSRDEPGTHRIPPGFRGNGRGVSFY